MTGVFGRILSALDQASLARRLAIAGAAGVFLALLGPFGTDTAPLWQRMAYWVGLCAAGTGLGITIAAVVHVLFDPADRRSFVMAFVTALVMTPPSTLVVWWVTVRLFSWRVMSGSLLQFTGPVLLICLAMNFVNALAHRSPPHTHASGGESAPPRFLERLPAKLRGAELYAVSAEDHYLRLHTSKGSDLILMRLSDAVAELEGLEGAQTHRSWWVARSAVRGARPGDGRAVLELEGGVSAPVSRGYARALKAEGWF
jgi:LytTr DNA-binding domain